MSDDIAKLKKRLHNLCLDWADDDTRIKDFARPFGIDVEGDSFGVPTMVDVVEEMAKLLAAARKDIVRLDKLDKMRRHYSRPPMRAVTGWEWSVVSEHSTTEPLLAAENVRSAIDNMEEPT